MKPVSVVVTPVGVALVAGIVWVLGPGRAGCWSTLTGRRSAARPGRPTRTWRRESLGVLREARLLTAAEVAAYLAQPVPDTPETIRNRL
ncbi:hypothetical protein ACFQQB_60470 [Nonomuraea rubra]|uniref:hypothetical protein n=1 Tax=Nonomuraea rubra TaxID=46180 RepID=UPI0036224F89